MKKRNFKLSIVAFAIIVTVLSACHKNDPGSNNNAVCPGTVVASWKVDGKQYQSSTPVFINTGSLWTLTLAACVNNEADRTISFSFLPTPVTVGSYPLKFKMLHAEQWNNYASADYLITNGGSYFTDSTGANSTGSLNITAVDTLSHVFSGTFNFNATNDSATQTVAITNGVLTNIQFQ